MSNEKNKAEGVEEAAERFVNSPQWIAGTQFLHDCSVIDEDEQFSRFYDFIAGWNKGQSDPAFISEIVEKTLALCNYTDKQIDVSSPEIVNQILKKI